MSHILLYVQNTPELEMKDDVQKQSTHLPHFLHQCLIMVLFAVTLC